MLSAALLDFFSNYIFGLKETRMHKTSPRIPTIFEGKHCGCFPRRLGSNCSEGGTEERRPTQRFFTSVFLTHCSYYFLPNFKLILSDLELKIGSKWRKADLH